MADGVHLCPHPVGNEASFHNVQLGLTLVTSSAAIGGTTTVYLLEQLCRLDASSGAWLFRRSEVSDALLATGFPCHRGVASLVCLMKHRHPGQQPQENQHDHQQLLRF